MILDSLLVRDCGEIAAWRNEARETLRTPGFTSITKQYDWQQQLDKTNHKYFAFRHESNLLAVGGLTDVEWENGLAEISLIVNPENRADGVGSDCVDMLLDEAFNKMNLQTVTGECYECNPGIKFWYRVIEKYNGYKTILRNRKFWNGKYYDSLYFSIDCTEFRA
jgi:RimJ/RimL family protein N-acetyltransferase